MGIKNFLLLQSVLLLFFAGCDNDGVKDVGQVVTGNVGDITFVTSFVPQTRVSTAADFTSAWEDGDEIGVFAVRAGERLASDGSNYINNLKLTYNSMNGGSWSGQAYWPNDRAALCFYAYYPYDDSAVDPTAMAFKVQTDQSGTMTGSTDKSNYSLSDLLTAKSDNDGEGWAYAQSVNLTFTHAMAMIQVSIPAGTATGSGPGENLKVKLNSLKSVATVNLGNIDAATPGNEVTLVAEGDQGANITMCRVEQPEDDNYKTSYTYRALVPPQVAAQGKNLFWFDHEERQLFSDEALSSPLQMTAGTAEAYEITLPATLLHTVSIPAGTFLMGSSDGSNIGNSDGSGLNISPAEPDRYANEIQHLVTLTQAFYMSKYQITNVQYVAFLNAKEVSYETDITSGLTSGDGGVCTWGDNAGRVMILTHVRGVAHDGTSWVAQRGYENHPVNNVTWYGAYEYAVWVGGALPTEAQWEYACRAGSMAAYGMGYNGVQITSENIGDYAWYSDSVTDGTEAVGQKQPNDRGLYDMHGNVWEWCADWYGEYGSEDVTDPTGIDNGLYRIVRGGSVNAVASNCRSAFRSFADPAVNYGIFGFRIVFLW